MRSDRGKTPDAEREIEEFLSQFEDPADELSADYSSYLGEKNTTKMTAARTFHWKQIDPEETGVTQSGDEPKAVDVSGSAPAPDINKESSKPEGSSPAKATDDQKKAGKSSKKSKKKKKGAQKSKSSQTGEQQKSDQQQPGTKDSPSAEKPAPEKPAAEKPVSEKPADKKQAGRRHLRKKQPLKSLRKKSKARSMTAA